jgi:ABC-type sulfate/molybdate transport systems ATPase subunit
MSIGESELEVPEWNEVRNQVGEAFVRTYDVQLHGSPTEGALDAVVRHVHSFGPVVRVELELVHDRRMIEAHLSRAQYARLAVTKDQRLYVVPTKVKVFPKDVTSPEASRVWRSGTEAGS